MNADIYERHKRAVEMWLKACQDVEYAENERRLARNVLDNVGQELLASCSDSNGKPEKKIRRRRTPKLGQFVEERKSDIGWVAKANGAAERVS